MLLSCPTFQRLPFLTRGEAQAGVHAFVSRGVKLRPREVKPCVKGVKDGCLVGLSGTEYELSFRTTEAVQREMALLALSLVLGC